MTRLDGPDRWEAAARRWLDHPTRQLGTAALVGLAVALGSAWQLTLNWRQAGFPADFTALFAVESLEWLSWAVLVPLVVAVDRRLRSASGRVVLLVHLALASAWFALISLPLAWALPLVDTAAESRTLAELYLSRVTVRFPTGWLVYAVTVLGVRLVGEFERSRRLDRHLAATQLRVLRAQLQPHFLFNALHTAASLVRSGDRDGTVEVLVSLSDLLRRSLGMARSERVPLAEEVDFLTRYVAIQERRFGDRLRVSIDVEPGLDEVPVPPFVLQPLVENSIRHGIEPNGPRGDVAILGRRTPTGLRLTVEDSGGRWNGNSTGVGTGLSNLEGRLAALYGARARLDVGVVEGRTRVTLTLPLAVESG